MLFEAFLVFWLLELFVILGAIAYFYYEPKQVQKKVWDPWGIWKDVK